MCVLACPSPLMSCAPPALSWHAVSSRVVSLSSSSCAGSPPRPSIIEALEVLALVSLAGDTGVVFLFLEPFGRPRPRFSSPAAIVLVARLVPSVRLLRTFGLGSADAIWLAPGPCPPRVARFSSSSSLDCSKNSSTRPWLMSWSFRWPRLTISLYFSYLGLSCAFLRRLA